MLDIRATSQFKKELKSIVKRGYKAELLWDVVSMLRARQALPERNRDHALSGDYVGFRECHIRPDWLLIYQIHDDKLVLVLSRTGTHSDLFN